MKEKTKEKIERRLESLQKHHIDTSVILEQRSYKSEEGRYCIKYLQKVGYNYKGFLSFPVLSELFSILLFLEKEEEFTFLDLIKGTIKAREIVLHCPENIEEISKRITDIDPRIDGLDKHILACAIEDKADILVTLDRKMVNNYRVEKEFKIKIRHPKDLL